MTRTTPTWKTLLWSALLAPALAFAFTGCGSQEAEPVEEPAEAVVEETTEVVEEAAETVEETTEEVVEETEEM